MLTEFANAENKVGSQQKRKKRKMGIDLDAVYWFTLAAAVARSHMSIR